MISGLITIWSGAIANIPSGFVLCDGNNGTPDLRNKFIPGAGDSYAVDAEGGAIAHQHNFTSDGHVHTIPGGSGIESGIGFAGTTASAVDTGTTSNASSLPPYLALAYIMKT